MKKVLILLMIGIIVSCSNDSKYIEIVKQKVKDDALGIDMNYKNISFQWMDTLTVGGKLKTGLDLYDEMLNKLLSSSYFSNESMNKENLNRITGAIQVYEKTGSLTKLQQVMGHSSLQVSLTYLRGLEVKQLDAEDMPVF